MLGFIFNTMQWGLYKSCGEHTTSPYFVRIQLIGVSYNIQTMVWLWEKVIKPADLKHSVFQGLAVIFQEKRYKLYKGEFSPGTIGPTYLQSTL